MGDYGCVAEPRRASSLSYNLRYPHNLMESDSDSYSLAVAR